MRKPWLIASLGLLAFSLLVWFAGPLLTVGRAAPLAAPQARVLLVAVFVAQYLLQKWWSARRARRDNERVVSVLAPADRPADRSTAGGREAAVLQERFASALRTLRDTQFGAPGGFWSSLSWKFGRQYLYQLPWYMIIGAPGAGKTTALLNSGLNFPLADTLGRGSIKGVGGTRNCDWWFTDRAVLIDTAGRYTTHESDRVADRQAWQAFLGLLRKSRPRQPLNGALVAVSVSDLMGFSPQQLAEHADTLRSRIDELQTALGMRIPVYLLVTKCDLMAGFVDWFFDLERRARDQVWGVTFEAAASDAGEAPGQFAAAFDRLTDRLGQGVMARLLTERDVQRRGRILALARQCRGLRDPLDELVRRVFGPRARALTGPATCLRGVYFTSGTQEGTPIDRMLSALGRELGLERQIVAPNQNSGRSFFLARLMNEVVFAEAELAGASLGGQRWRRRVIMVAMAAVQSVAVVLAASWATGYSRTSDSLAGVQAQAEQVRALVQAVPAAVSPDPRPLLPALDALRTFAAERADASHSADALLLGLTRRPQRKLAAAADQAYERLLLGPLLAGIRTDIDEQMRTGADVDLQYEALKAYAMLNDSAHFDASALNSFVLFDWDTRSDPPLSAADRTELAEHLGALLEAGAVGAGSGSDAALVESVRARLAGQPPVRRIATRLRAQLGALPVADFTIAVAGPAAAELFVGADGRSAPRVVPGRYSLEAYRNASVNAMPAIASQLAAEASWVLGVPQGPGSSGAQALASDQTTAEVIAIYDAEYARAWVDFVDDLHLKRAARNDDAVRQAQVLAGRDGPLATLLRKVVEQSAPVSRALPPASTPNRARGSSRPLPQAAGAPEGPGDRLRELRQFVLPAADGRSGLDAALGMFNEIHVLRSLAAAPGASAPTVSGAADMEATSADRIERLRAAARRDPEPVRSMLLALAVLPSPAAGKRKVPISSRLYQIAYPSSSQTRSLIRSAALFRKTKMFPDRGSPTRASRTRAAKLSNDFLRSVGCAQSQMRTVAGKLNMPCLRPPRRRADERG